MKKIIDKIKNLKINSSVFIFITIIFVSALGLQASKIYAQNSNLSRDLSVKHQAYLDGSLKVGGNLGIGTSNPAHRLSVNGVANFEGVSSGKKPEKYQLNALVTVGYVDAAIDAYLASLNIPPSPTLTCTTQEKEVTCYPDLSGPPPYSLESCSSGQYKYFTFDDFSPGGRCFLTTICCNNPSPGSTPASSFNPYTIY